MNYYYITKSDDSFIINGPDFNSVPIKDEFQANYWCDSLNRVYKTAYKKGINYKEPLDDTY
jgi:hypothetical protein